MAYSLDAVARDGVQPRLITQRANSHWHYASLGGGRCESAINGTNGEFLAWMRVMDMGTES